MSTNAMYGPEAYVNEIYVLICLLFACINFKIIYANILGVGGGGEASFYYNKLSNIVILTLLLYFCYWH